MENHNHLRLRSVQLSHLSGGKESPQGSDNVDASRQTNFSKWVSFGLDPSKHSTSGGTSIRHNELLQQQPVRSEEVPAVRWSHPPPPSRGVPSSWLMEEELYGHNNNTINMVSKEAPQRSTDPTTVNSKAARPEYCAAASLTLERESATQAVGQTSALRKGLMDWSNRVKEAAEIERCRPPKPEKKSSPFSHQHKWNKKKNDSSQAGSSHEKSEGGGDNKQQTTLKRSRSGKNKKTADAQASSTVTAHHPPGSNFDDANASGSNRTLFSFNQPTSASSAACAVVAVPYTRLEDTTFLFDDLEAELRDPNRIQAPPLYLGLVMGATAAETVGKETSSNICPLGVQPCRAHECISDLVFRWKEKVFTADAASIGYDFILRVFRELVGVEVITFNAPAAMLPLLSYAHGDVFTHCISDVRLMAWMLSLAEAPSNESTNDLAVLLRKHKVYPQNAATLQSPEGRVQTAVNETFYLAPLYRVLYGQLGAKGLLQAFLRQEKRISCLIASMKFNGVRVDLREVRRLRDCCAADMDEWRSRARALVPQLPDFNIQSHDQCREAIYDILQLGQYLGQEDTAGATTKKGKLSTAEDALKVLGEHHVFPQYIIKYRKAAKMLQTYTEGMMSFALPCAPSEDGGSGSNDGGGDSTFVDTALTHGKEADGKEEGNTFSLETEQFASLHPNFIQEGTDTGRLSCVEPNLQNLPWGTVVSTTPSSSSSAGEDQEGSGAETDQQQQQQQQHLSFRRCFIAPEGCTLVSVDFQQIELRVLAHLCADAALVDALTKSTDIHRAIAQILFKKRDVTSEERSVAKRAVFGTIYGAGPRLLATKMNVSVEHALHVSSLLKREFPQIGSFHDRLIQQCRTEGFVRTISGRVRYLADMNSSVMGNRMYAERQAFNTVVQGSAADIMKMAMLAVEKEVLQPHHRDVHLLLQIHDEIVLSVKKELLAEVVPRVVKAMTRAVSLLVPLSVTAKFGSSLGNLEEWTIEHDLGVA